MSARHNSISFVSFITKKGKIDPNFTKKCFSSCQRESIRLQCKSSSTIHIPFRLILIFQVKKNWFRHREYEIKSTKRILNCCQENFTLILKSIERDSKMSWVRTILTLMTTGNDAWCVLDEDDEKIVIVMNN